MSKQPDWTDSCIECGAALSFLRDHPRRVGAAIWASMLIGLGLLIALFATVFDQLVGGNFPTLAWSEALELVLGVILSLIGARAWATLRQALLRRFARGPGEPANSR